MSETDELGRFALTVPGASGRYTLARVTEADAATLAALHDEAAQWLWERGIHQWRPGAYTAEHALAAIRAGHEVYLVRRGRSPVGKFTLQWDDVETWGECPPDAGYVHALCVRRVGSGVGLGAALLDWASQRVAARGRDWLRLDCMAANPALRAWYERLGFVYRGEAEEGWAALYERPAAG